MQIFEKITIYNNTLPQNTPLMGVKTAHFLQLVA